MKKKVLQKVNQAGSMMIEALAMLALVSLVTPTLYKKAAERTMELQDINSATQIRALIKAADSYTSANFANLVEELGGGEEPSGQSKVISSDNLRAYLPEGYQLDSIKNFGAPKAAVKIGGTKGHETLTSYVVLPQQGTLNSVRSARIASMVGANGGIVDKDGDENVLDGVGNIWKLDKENYANVFGSDNAIQQYSVGAISEHAINVGNSNSLENPKYLQRTHDDGEEWRNTMETTLYMGGTTDMDGAGVKYQSIEGVNRLIIGGTTWDEDSQGGTISDNREEALIIKSHKDKDGHDQLGSVWIEDSFAALYDSFRLTGNENSFNLQFGGEKNEGSENFSKPLIEAEQTATAQSFSIETGNTNKPENQDKDLIIDNQGALLNVNTKIDNTLETTGKTSLASTGDKTGIVIQPTVAASEGTAATDSSTSIYTKTTGIYSASTTVYGENNETRTTAKIDTTTPSAGNTDVSARNVIFDVQGSAYVNKALEVGSDADGEKNLYDPSNAEKPILLQEGDRELNVVGDAFVSDTLEAGFVAAHDFDAMNIHAGGKDYTDNLDKGNNDMGKYNRWLNATENGVFVEDLGDENKEGTRDLRMQITDGTTQLYGPKSPLYNNNNEITGYAKGAVLELGQNEAQLHARNEVNIYSEAVPGKNVNIQNGAIVASGQAGQGNLDNTINMRAKEITVRGSNNTDTVINNSTAKNTALIIKPGDDTDTSLVRTDVKKLTIMDHEGKGTGESHRPLVEINSVSQAFGNTGTDIPGPYEGMPTVGINAKQLGVWGTYDPFNRSTPVRQILQVDASTNDPTGGENDVGSAGAINTPRDGSVYIRRGAIEIEPFKEDDTTQYGADEGLGYIEASRFVANNVDENGNIRKPVYVNNNSSDTYDRYMLNPAYTSVMHDIKLTTRGGARLSDILPDFITKGIYLVTNTYKEGSTPTDLRSIDDSSQFASPYLGYVPAPTCPEGYARVITLTPASFQMAQAGTLTRDNKGRFYVSESNPVQRGGSLYNIINKNLLEPGNSITGAKLEQKYVMTAQDVPAQNMWYLGYDNGPQDTGPTYGTGESAVQYAPTPLYFQQSTWLKAATPSYAGKTACAQANTSCNADRWMTIIGFLYPKGSYGALADALLGSGNEGADVEDSATENANEFYWNLFPVMPDTIEAYATVYCYFDRTEIFGTDVDPNYVKQYDLQPSDDYGNVNYKDNSEYKKRLNDPHLKYEDPL